MVCPTRYSKNITTKFIVSRAAAQLVFIKRPSRTKDVYNEIIWTLELDAQNGFDVPFYVFQKVNSVNKIKKMIHFIH